MSNASQPIVNTAWNFAHVLRAGLLQNAVKPNIAPGRRLA